MVKCASWRRRSPIWLKTPRQCSVARFVARATAGTDDQRFQLCASTAGHRSAVVRNGPRPQPVRRDLSSARSAADLQLAVQLRSSRRAMSLLGIATASRRVLDQRIVERAMNRQPWWRQSTASVPWMQPRPLVVGKSAAAQPRATIRWAQDERRRSFIMTRGSAYIRDHLHRRWCRVAQAGGFDLVEGSEGAFHVGQPNNRHENWLIGVQRNRPGHLEDLVRHHGVEKMAVGSNPDRRNASAEAAISAMPTGVPNDERQDVPLVLQLSRSAMSHEHRVPTGLGFSLGFDSINILLRRSAAFPDSFATAAGMRLPATAPAVHQRSSG